MPDSLGEFFLRSFQPLRGKSDLRLDIHPAEPIQPTQDIEKEYRERCNRIPTAFPPIATAITARVREKLPPQLLNINPALYFHPLLHDQQSGEVHLGAVSLPSFHEIHSVSDIFDLLPNEDKLPALGIDQTSYWQQVRATLAAYNQKLESFIAEKSTAYNMKRLKEKSRLIKRKLKKIDPTYDCIKINSGNVPSELEQAYMEQVVIPVLSDDSIFIQSLERELETDYTHEYAHQLLDTLYPSDKKLSADDLSRILFFEQRVRSVLDIDHQFQALLEKAHLGDSDHVNQFTPEFKRLNQMFVTAIAAQLPPALRTRYLYHCGFEGLVEAMAIAFQRVVSNDKKSYSDNILTYADTPAMFLGFAEDEIDQLEEEIQRRSLEAFLDIGREGLEIIGNVLAE